MRNTDEEAEHWNLWARLPPIAMLLILLSSVAFADGAKMEPGVIKDGKIYMSIASLDAESVKAIKLDSSSYRLKTTEDQPIMDFSMKNNITPSNIIADCQNTPYTCDMKLRITPNGQNIVFDNDLIDGGWKDGEAYVQKVFFYQNETYEYKEPIWVVNGYIGETHIANLTQNGTTTIKTTRIIEQEDLSKLYSNDGQPVDIIIRFARDRIKKVDIYPVILGHEYTEWSYWGTGGTETTYINSTTGVNWTVHTFTSNGTFTLNNMLNVSVLIISGGGAGGTGQGGGGGAGGIYYNSSMPLSSGEYNVTVGSGGTKGALTGNDLTTKNLNGTDSSFTNITTLGGGRGASQTTSNHVASDGGSGGGGAGYQVRIHGVGTAGQGNDGGDGTASANYGGGGGGGAGGAGGYGTVAAGGDGGAGSSFNITGTLTCYAGGGGAGIWTSGAGGNATCGGGAGALYDGVAATANTGGGGGAGGNDGSSVHLGGDGGAGIVIISYPSLELPITATLISPMNNSEYPLNTTSVPISFNCSGISNSNYLANLTVNNADYNNATGIIAYNNATTNFTINMSITTTGSFTWGVLCYNTTASAYSANNTFEIHNFAPNITSLTIAPNDSVYQLGDLYFNITITHLDQHPMNASYSWLKNGVNQTSLAGSVEILNNTPTVIYNTATPFSAGDNWSVSVYATDGMNDSAVSTTTNTTINSYFGNATFYSPSAYQHIYTQAYMNFTLRNATSATAYFVFGSSNTTMTNSGSGINYVLTTSTAIAGATTNGTWYYKATLANSSTYETSYSESINVSDAGFFLCNASINTTSIFYQFQDAVLFTPINATFVGTYVWIGDDGVSTSTVLSNTSTNTSICIYPDTFNRVALATEVSSATGYLTSVVSVPAANYSAGSLNKTVYLINISAGAFYTFQTINQYNSPVSGASVIVLKVGGTTPTTYITDITGSAYVPLIQLSTYTMNVSASGYNNVSFPFVAGTTTTIQIKLSIAGAGVAPPNYTDVFQTVQYILLPDSTSINNATPIVFSTNSPNSTLQAFGMYIFKNYQGNVTLVYNTSNTNPTGGSLSYLATSEGMYIVYPWFKASGYANYTPFPTTFSYGNATSPTSQATTALQGGGIISGWSYYFVALVVAMLVAVGLSRYTIDGAAFGGLAVLVLATILNPSIVVYDFGMFAVTTVHLTTMAGVMAASVVYLRQYGV